MSKALFGRVRMTGGGSARTGPGGQFLWLGTEAPFEASGGGSRPRPQPARSGAGNQLCPILAVLKAAGSCQKTTAIL